MTARVPETMSEGRAREDATHGPHLEAASAENGASEEADAMTLYLWQHGRLGADVSSYTSDPGTPPVESDLARPARCNPARGDGHKGCLG